MGGDATDKPHKSHWMLTLRVEESEPSISRDFEKEVLQIHLTGFKEGHGVKYRNLFSLGCNNILLHPQQR